MENAHGLGPFFFFVSFVITEGGGRSLSDRSQATAIRDGLVRAVVHEAGSRRRDAGVPLPGAGQSLAFTGMSRSSWKPGWGVEGGRARTCQLFRRSRFSVHVHTEDVKFLGGIFSVFLFVFDHRSLCFSFSSLEKSRLRFRSIVFFMAFRRCCWRTTTSWTWRACSSTTSSSRRRESTGNSSRRRRPSSRWAQGQISAQSFLTHENDIRNFP